MEISGCLGMLYRSYVRIVLYIYNDKSEHSLWTSSHWCLRISSPCGNVRGHEGDRKCQDGGKRRRCGCEVSEPQLIHRPHLHMTWTANSVI
jgi:hypothetical protein